MSPFEIEVLLHYYSRCVDFEVHHAPAFSAAVQRFIEDGLMEFEGMKRRSYRLTEKGDFYVKHGLCAVPLPVPVSPKWEIPK